MVSDLSAPVLKQLRYRVQVFAGFGKLSSNVVLYLCQTAKSLVEFDELRADFLLESNSTRLFAP